MSNDRFAGLKARAAGQSARTTNVVTDYIADLDQLTRLSARDLAPRIRVNAVAPGSIETDALGSVLNDDMRRTMTSMTPLQRLGRVEDIAVAVVYLASDASSFLTGKVIEVDGGLNVPNLPLGLPDL